ncbi:ABC transporter permease [Streptomyces beihaiensis]|uniref:FtsX-like permease family protein n=1 Tax=Streptomyces beihaiensis TaxID=2984495 RepID=A0ABT3U4E1_9ACTN|nr:FtsX-like permease family protein [Streptomyces beihaiensis]MCX3063432.1 FtsX-like permease family protein [Streptomyces beihaiensis]
MFRTALRNVFAHKARLLMTVLAVMLGVAFVSGTLVFTNTISHALSKSSAKGFDHVDVALTPGATAAAGDKVSKEVKLTDATLGKAESVPGAASAYGVVSGYAAVAGQDGKLVGNGFASQGGNYWAGSGGKDVRYPLKEGSAPHGRNQVALDAKTAERAGYKVGDRVRLSVDGPVLTPTLSGIFTTDDGNVAAGGSLALFDTATAQRLFHKPGAYDEIDVTAAAGTGQDRLKRNIGKALGDAAVHTETGQQLADDQASQITSSMSSMRTMLLIFAGIALFVGVFIIANTFTMLVAQRTKELALMRAVGASRRQVTRSVLLEAFVVGSVAAVTGLAVGVGIGAGMRALISDTGAVIPDGPLVVSPGTVVSALVVGILVTLLAAWLPGHRAAKIPPVAAMSAVHAAPTTKSLVLRNTLGALVSAVGVTAVLAATAMSGSSGRMPMAAGAGLLVIGVFILTPVLSRPLIAAAAPVLRAFGVSGKLARLNAVRNPRRTAATASALMIGLTLITGLTVIAGSVQSGIDKMAADSLKADYVVSMANGNPLSPEVLKTLDKTDGVTATSGLSNSPSRIDGTTEFLTGVNGGTIRQLAQLTMRSGTFTVGGSHVVVDDETAEQHSLTTGSSFTVHYEDGKRQRLKVAGVYQHNEIMRGILIDTRTLDPHLTDAVSDMQVMVKTSGGATDATKDRLTRALGDNPAVKVQDRQDISDQVARIFTLMLNMLYGLLAMAVIVAVLGVINTLAMSVFERRQEIGMLRAIGVNRKGVKRMVRLESLIISLFGGALGLGLGVFFGWAAGELISGSLSTYELNLPWGRMALFLALAAVVGILAALWPARRAARLNMLAAIKAE